MEVIYRKLYLNKAKNPDKYLNALRQDFKTEIQHRLPSPRDEEEKSSRSSCKGKLPLKKACQLLAKYIDPLEIDRIFQGYEEDEGVNLSLSDALDAIKDRHSKDLDLCAKWGYSKLSLTKNNQLPI